MSISLSELETRLWAAANALRGPVDPADFKTYVFPMLFWKWISDTWTWEHNQAVAEYGPNVHPEVEADFHRFVVPDGTHWDQVTTATHNLGAKINTALGKLQQANPETLAGIFGDAAWGNKERLPESALVNLLGAFDGLVLNPDEVTHDMLGQAYEYLLKNFADSSGAKAGEFFTPRQVVKLLVRLLDPQPGESVYDPACGSGGMLVETINTVREHGGDTRTLRLYGQEVNLTTSAIARMNLFLHDIEDFKIVRGDTLRQPGLRNPNGSLSQFDVVIANPPFSLKSWGRENWVGDPRAFCGVPPDDKADFAWVQHMLASMSPNGRVGVVMPHGVLFRGGSEGRIRRCLVEQGKLEAVIGLPDRLFYSTGISACILVFRADRAAHPADVLFVDASSRFHKLRNQNEMSSADVEAVLAAYHGEVDSLPDGVETRRVLLDELAKNHFDLSLSKYVRRDASVTADLAAALSHYADARDEADSASSDVGGTNWDEELHTPAEGWRRVTIGDVAMVNPESIPKTWEQGQRFQYVDIASVSWDGGISAPAVKATTLGEAPGRARRRIRTSDVLVSTVRPNLRAFAQVGPDFDGEVASTGFAVVRANRNEVLPDYLWLVIRSEAFVQEMVSRCTGSNYPAVRGDDVAAFEFDLPPTAVQQQIVDGLNRVDRLRASLRAELAAADNVAYAVVNLPMSTVEA
ncbi:MAG: N-6 DNA methylase [Brooklawnia sp.]|jgi:type I restriction enzyme M protein